MVGLGAAHILFKYEFNLEFCLVQLGFESGLARYTIKSRNIAHNRLDLDRSKSYLVQL